MDTDTLAALVMARVREVDYVSLVEVERLLESHIDVRGDMVITLDTDPNCILWANVSEQFVDVFDRVTAHGDNTARMEPASRLTYLVDGKTLSLPLVQRPPKTGYKAPHWLPIYLRPVDAPVRRARR